MPPALELAAVVATMVAAIAVTYAVTRAHGMRQLADARVALAAEMSATKQDNQWLRHELERQQQSLGATQALLDKAEVNLREAFQSLAAEALHTNRGAFLDLAKTAFEGLTKQSTVQMDARQRWCNPCPTR